MIRKLLKSDWQSISVFFLLCVAVGLSIPPFRFLIEQSMMMQMAEGCRQKLGTYSDLLDVTYQY